MPVEIVPESEIWFAAKIGFLRKSLWNEFFAKGSSRWRRRQWLFFQRRSYFFRHPSSLARDVIVLNPKNLMVRELVGEDISSPPFAPQITHDEIMARSLLVLTKSGLIQDYKVEAELKRESIGQRKVHDASEKLKFPDAIVRTTSAGTFVRLAVELELTRKNPKRYRQIIGSYATKPDLNRVIFIARSNLIFENLRAAMRETYYPDWERPIGFCHLDDWIRDPANAAIHFNDGVTTLAKIAGVQVSDGAEKAKAA